MINYPKKKQNKKTQPKFIDSFWNFWSPILKGPKKKKNPLRKETTFCLVKGGIAFKRSSKKCAKPTSSSKKLNIEYTHTGCVIEDVNITHINLLLSFIQE